MDKAPEWAKWFFDGFGTQIITGIISLLIGGIGGFALGRKTKSRQIQKAGDSAKQKQAFAVAHGNGDQKKNKELNSLIQKQKAGNNAEQVQTGNIKHV